MLDSTFCPDSISLFYFEDFKKKSANFKVLKDTVKQAVIIDTPEMSWIAIGKRINFILYLSIDDQDTISLHLEEKNENCCTFFSFEHFMINGFTPVNDPEFYAYEILK